MNPILAGVVAVVIVTWAVYPPGVLALACVFGVAIAFAGGTGG